MSFNVTDRALGESERPVIEPQLVLEIDGLETLFGAVTISRLVRIGDPGLLIGDTWRIGGVLPIANQRQNINFDSGSTTSIQQQLYPDKGSVSSISSVQLAMNDEALIMTQVISPGILLEEILGRKATLWMGFKNTAFKDDYVEIFTGIIDDVESGSGIVKLNIAAPDTLKRQSLFTPVTLTVSDTVNDTDTSIQLDDASLVPLPGLGPTGAVDPAITYFIKLNDEIISYAGVAGNTLTGCVRGALATLAARHVINQSIQVITTPKAFDSILSEYFSFWSADNVNKYYVWANGPLGIGTDPGTTGTHPDLVGAIGIPYSWTGTDPESLATGIAAALGPLAAVFTVVRSGACLTISCVDAGKASDPDSANSGFATSVIDPGADEITAQTLVEIADTAVNVALKLMLSGVNDFYVKDLPATRYLHPSITDTVSNSVFFDGINLNRDYGVCPGDFVTITDATAGANNCTTKVIDDVVITDEGSYIVVDSVAFVTESPSTALVSIRSQYDTLGVGMQMTPDQVDVAEHQFWRDYIMSNMNYRFVIQDVITGKDFLEKEVYLPVGAFSLPRQGRCSMGYTVGPVVRGEVKTLDRTNIKDPDKITLKRTINRNFYNVVIYQMDQTVSDTSQYVNNIVTDDEDSQSRIPVGSKPFTISSAGLRKDLGGFSIAEAVSERWLARYRFAAEYFENIGLLFKNGYSIEPGDTVMFDPTGLQVSETTDGTREKKPKLFTVVNKSMDLKTGDVKVSLTDTNFDGTQRYGIVSPSSLITGGTTTALKIKDSFGAIFPGNESRKWKDYFGLRILVHSQDWTFEQEVNLLGIDPTDPYVLLLDPTTPLSMAPTDGLIIDVPNYPVGTDTSENAKYKAVFCFLSHSVAVASGADDTHFDVGSGDGLKFTVGGAVLVHSPDYSDWSPSVKVLSITGDTIETDATLGFTPDNTDTAQEMPFADGGATYRLF